jgi:antitoxin component YwqK of YwqJK toxin-antitoxin module
MKLYIFILNFLFFFGISVAQTNTDANGKKQGYWKKVDPITKKIIYEGLFKDDVAQGLFRYYYPNDSLKAKMLFVQNGKIGYSTLFHETGKRMAYGKYINEIKDSVWTYYDENGNLISKENFVSGKKDGIVYTYFTDGVVSEMQSYKLGVKHGPFKQYFDKIHIKGEGNYVNGLIDGKNSYYYPNGVIVATGYYKNGLKNGPWIYNEKDGKIKDRELYKLGKLASKVETEEFFNKYKRSDDSPKKTDTTIKKNKPNTSK